MILYFVDKQVSSAAATPSFLASVGLHRVFGDSKIVTRGVEAGPGGKRGTILYPHEHAQLPTESMQRVGYWPDKQRWESAGAYWCGMHNDAVVTPEDLRRGNGLEGGWLKLSDGNEWEVAYALYGDGGARLPRKLRINPTGFIESGDVLEAHREFSEAAGAFFAKWMEGVSCGTLLLRYDRDLLAQLAVMGLQANYRIGLVEAVNLLGLFDETNVWDAALCTISWPTILQMKQQMQEAEKKNNDPEAPNGVDSECGQADA